jgi:hypothetical protein
VVQNISCEEKAIKSLESRKSLGEGEWVDTVVEKELGRVGAVSVLGEKGLPRSLHFA